MKYWRELPYRGDGQPKGPKPRRQFRNLRKERRETVVTTLVVFLALVLVFAFVLAAPDAGFDQTRRMAAIIIAVPFILLFTIGIAKGLTSINRFRKGYDVDVSDREKEDDQKPGNLID